MGTNKNEKDNLFLYDEETHQIKYHRNIMMNDGMLRCFTEVISNAIDNFFRSRFWTNTYDKITSQVRF